MSVQEFYNKKAPRYDERHSNETVRHMERFEKAFIERYAKGLVLDVGCGTGRTISWVKNVVGTDPSLNMLKIARNKTFSPLVMAEAESLPFNDASIDSITCMFTVLNLCDYRQAAKEMRRVLKAKGSVILSATSAWEKKNYPLKARLRKGKPANMKVRVDRMRLKFHLFTKQELIEVFAGFELKDFRGLFFLQRPYWGGKNTFTLTEKAKLSAERLLRFSPFNESAKLYFAVFEKL